MAFGFIGAILGFCFGTAFAFGIIAFDNAIPTDGAEIVRVARGLAVVMAGMGSGLSLLILVKWFEEKSRRKRAANRRAASG